MDLKSKIILIYGPTASGKSLFAIQLAKKIDGEISCVISNNPEAYGIERAKKLNLKSIIVDHNLFNDRSEFDDQIDKILVEEKIELVVLAGFMRILEKKITDKYFGRMINLHPSLLPLYPGLNTHKKVIKNKDNKHGVSIHYVSPELDAGPIIAQGSIEVKKNETAEDLQKRIHKIEHILLPEVINEICIGNIFLSNNSVKFKNKNITNHIINSYDE